MPIMLFVEIGPGLVQRAYTEEVAAGTSPEEAAVIVEGILRSPEYRVAWEAELLERLREHEEEVVQEPTYCPCLTGCPECGGVPNHEF